MSSGQSLLLMTSCRSRMPDRLSSPSWFKAAFTFSIAAYRAEVERFGVPFCRPPVFGPPGAPMIIFSNQFGLMPSQSRHPNVQLRQSWLVVVLQVVVVSKKLPKEPLVDSDIPGRVVVSRRIVSRG